MIAASFRVPVARLARSRGGWLPILGWSAFAVLAAWSASRSASGTDHVLRGTFGVVVLPLLSYGIVSAALGGSGMRAAIKGLVALGGRPDRAALGALAVAASAAAFGGAVLAAIVCAVAHGPADPPLGDDLVTSAGVALLGGAAYAAYFCAGSAIGRGAMRGVFLVGDWVLGGPAGFGALFTPRGHVMSLLGAAPCYDLSRRTSSVLLVVLAVAYASIALRLARRPR